MQNFKLNQLCCFDLRSVRKAAAITMKLGFIVDFFVCLMDFWECSDCFIKSFIKKIDCRLKVAFRFS